MPKRLERDDETMKRDDDDDEVWDLLSSFQYLAEVFWKVEGCSDASAKAGSLMHHAMWAASCSLDSPRCAAIHGFVSGNAIVFFLGERDVSFRQWEITFHKKHF